MKRKITKLDEVADFRFSLSNETDRGAALVCAAFLEEDLKALLERYFIDVPKVVSRLLDQSGPLATFSAKIDLSFVSGLISEEMYRALHLLRRIRNSFAHYHKPRSFNDEDISNQCSELAKITGSGDMEHARGRFIGATIWMLAGVHSFTEGIARVS